MLISRTVRSALDVVVFVQTIYAHRRSWITQVAIMVSVSVSEMLLNTRVCGLLEVINSIDNDQLDVPIVSIPNSMITFLQWQLSSQMDEISSNF